VATPTTSSAKTLKATAQSPTTATTTTAAPATATIPPKAVAAIVVEAETDPAPDAAARVAGVNPQAGSSQDDSQSDPSTSAANAAGATLPPTFTALAINVPPAAALAAAHGADITAQLAAQIASRAGAAATGFNFSLDPQGLGRVNVSLKFDSQGQMSAVLSFDNAAAAAEAKGRAGDLQQSLQQAGFNLSQSGLSFTSGGQGQGAGSQGANQPAYARDAPLIDASPDALAFVSAARASSAGGLDITI
jgi:hypothetical protein